jgi:hypothetical protein
LHHDAEKIYLISLKNKNFVNFQRLRRETTMSLKWIALRLQMGSWSYVFNLLAANRGRKR